MFDRKQYLDRLEQLVNMDSGSRSPEKIAAVADVLAGWYREIGWTVIRHDLGSETGPLLEIANRGTQSYDAVLLGHMDTVFPDGTAAARPFTIKGGLAYGPGVADMKQGLVTMYFIARELNAMGDDAPSVCMMYNPDEEIGSCYSVDKMNEIMRKSPRLFVMEAAKKGDLHCNARRGRLKFRVEFHGRSAHAGNMLTTPHASAILEAAKWTQMICGMLNAEEEVTANVGLIEGGTAVNAVPERASLNAELRANTRQVLDRLLDTLRKTAERPFTPGVSVEIRDVSVRPPFQANEATMVYIETARAIAAELGQGFEVGHRGGVSDANSLCAAKELICLDGMGPTGEKAHSPEEYLVLDSIEPNLRLMVALLRQLKGGAN